jgi:serine/threonine protein phosphatase PrpC
MPTQLRAAALTDPGRTREINEDTVYKKITASPDGDTMGLFIVADGIGGRLAGEVASYWAVETVKDSLSDIFSIRDPRETVRFPQDELPDTQATTGDPRDTLRISREELLNAQAAAQNERDLLLDRIKAAVERANDVVRLYAAQKLDKAGDIGTTITMAMIIGRDALIANVGDSRTYLLRNKQLHQITRDHSYVQRLIEGGYVEAKERYNHPYRNLIFRSLGTEDAVKVDVFAVTLHPGDYLLLCTDGLWEMVQGPGKIAEIINGSPSLETACQGLVDAANVAGGEDNIGIVIAQVLA